MQKEICILEKLEKCQFNDLFPKVLVKIGQSAFAMEYMGSDL